MMSTINESVSSLLNHSEVRCICKQTCPESQEAHGLIMVECDHSYGKQDMALWKSWLFIGP